MKFSLFDVPKTVSLWICFQESRWICFEQCIGLFCILQKSLFSWLSQSSSSSLLLPQHFPINLFPGNHFLETFLPQHSSYQKPASKFLCPLLWCFPNNFLMNWIVSWNFCRSWPLLWCFPSIFLWILDCFENWRNNFFFLENLDLFKFWSYFFLGTFPHFVWTHLWRFLNIFSFCESVFRQAMAELFSFLMPWT